MKTNELTIEHLDFEFEIPCEALEWKDWLAVEVQPVHRDEGVPAEWKLVKSCCGEVKFYCDPCVVRSFHYQTAFCQTCGTKLSISEAWTQSERFK